jgi:hypothetical protein
MNVPPFPDDYRASGVLLHATSLPSPYGIGDLGPAAVAWIDRLHDAGQGWWQLLPLGPTGYGDSPYQPLSSFAGNVLLISPAWLIEDGLVRASDCGGGAGRAQSGDRRADESAGHGARQLALASACGSAVRASARVPASADTGLVPIRCRTTGFCSPSLERAIGRGRSLRVIVDDRPSRSTRPRC